MFVYEKKLQYPVKIANVNPQLASIIISQYGGPYSILLQSRVSENEFIRDREEHLGFVERAAVDDGHGGFVLLRDGGCWTTERFKDCGDGIPEQRGGIDDGDGCGFGNLRVEVVKLRLHLLPGGFIGFQRLDAV